MEVPFSHDEQTRINQLASQAGQDAEQFVRSVVNGYFEEWDEVRNTLSTRYEDIQSGRVQAIDGEEAFARLRRKSEERRATRS